jgi:uncharacterized protein
MEFEYDPEKSRANREKHGIDFEEARDLWADPDAIGFRARSDDEERFALLGIVREKLWVAFFTYREQRIRLISVRRARTAERKLYEG